MKLKLRKKKLNRMDRYETSGGSVRFHKYDDSRENPVKVKPEEVPDAVKKELLRHGTLFTNSLARIYKLVVSYREGDETKDGCIAELTKEWGWGGLSSPINEDLKHPIVHSFSMNGSKGVDLEYFIPNKGFFQCKLTPLQYFNWAIVHRDYIKECAIERGQMEE